MGTHRMTLMRALLLASALVAVFADFPPEAAEVQNLLQTEPASTNQFGPGSPMMGMNQMPPMPQMPQMAQQMGMPTLPMMGGVGQQMMQQPQQMMAPPMPQQVGMEQMMQQMGGMAGMSPGGMGAMMPAQQPGMQMMQQGMPQQPEMQMMQQGMPQQPSMQMMQAPFMAPMQQGMPQQPGMQMPSMEQMQQMMQPPSFASMQQLAQQGVNVRDLLKPQMDMLGVGGDQKANADSPLTAPDASNDQGLLQTGTQTQTGTKFTSVPGVPMQAGVGGLSAAVGMYHPYVNPFLFPLVPHKYMPPPPGPAPYPMPSYNPPNYYTPSNDFVAL